MKTIKDLIKSLYLLSFIFIFYTCEEVKDPDKFFINIKLQIVSINGDCSLSQDKFHTSQLCNIILFKTIDGPELYREINTCKMPATIHIDTKWLYNHRIGDLVHFDYLIKSEFFEIKIDKNY